MRDGRSIIRSARIPKPVVLVDTRERKPFPLHVNHPNWIAGERRVALKTGDYTVMGMEGLLALERKNLADLVPCTVTYRRQFLAACGHEFRWKAILIEATYEDIKGGFEPFGIPSGVHPNAVCGLVDAIEAKFGIPFIYASTMQDLATERAAGAGSRSISPTGGWSSRASVGSDRLRPIVIAVEGGLMRRCGLTIPSPFSSHACPGEDVCRCGKRVRPQDDRHPLRVFDGQDGSP